MSKNEKGFGAVEGFLCLLIIGVISFVSWYVWHTSNQSKNEDTTQTNSSLVKEQKSDQVIVVEELGIKFTVPGSEKELQNLNYSVDEDDLRCAELKIGPCPTVYFSTLEIDKWEPREDGSHHSILGWLTKTPGQYPKEASVENSTGALVKQSNTYYISSRGPTGAYFDNPDYNIKGLEIRTKLVEVIKSSLEEI